MPADRRKTGAVVAAVVAAVLGVGGCSWIGSDADAGGPRTTAPPQQPVAPPGPPKPGPGMVVEGRAWRRGRRRRAAVVAARWGKPGRRPAPPVAGLDGDSARALAAAWARSGEYEQASVRAFTDLADALRAHGAPDALVARCEVAAAQEADHAARCVALASRYAGREVSIPPPAGRRRTRPAVPTLAVIAAESIVDGILNEGAAALIAAEQAKVCSDTTAAEALAVIAGDEAAHADLAWSVLEWCLQVGSAEVRRAVAGALAVLPVPRVPPAPAGVGAAVAAAHGRAAPSMHAELTALRADVCERVERLVERRNRLDAQPAPRTRASTCSSPSAVTPPMILASTLPSGPTR